MIKHFLSTLLLLCALSGVGQALRDINYNYLYNPAGPFSFDLRSVRNQDSWNFLYALQIKDTTLSAGDLSLQWEFRQSLNEKEGTPANFTDTKESPKDKSGFSGVITTALSSTGNIIVCKVLNTKTKRAWIFYKVLESNYPVNRYLALNDKAHTKPFVTITDRVKVNGSDSTVVSYYNDNFPAAPPAFAESQSRVSAGIRADSTFVVSAGQEMVLPMVGLYLVQSDTNSTDGLAFRVENDYPRFTRVSSLAGPLMYICTRDEMNRLGNAKNDKKAFDRIILSITNDTERARTLIRNYFRRVELANLYFTSYKEGWKTDRGMIYIIFGLPTEVFKFNDREVWNYDNDYFKITFNFSKSSSIFDPENYVLIREKRYRETWLETVDLWRGARF